MIRLTLLNGKHWYVNPDHIVGIKSGHKYGAAIESDHQTGIEHTIDVTQVQESPEEVARKVLEWKYIMQKGAYTNTQEMARLRELAGLEEQV
jgi:hypothetical protein